VDSRRALAVTGLRNLAVGGSLLVFALALAIIASAHMHEALSGLRPLRPPAALDLEGAAGRDGGDVAGFLVARDRLGFTVGEEIRVAQFRELYSLGRDPVHEGEDGEREMAADERLVPGKSYFVILTPRRAGQ
jgi:hypothetical protein